MRKVGVLGVLILAASWFCITTPARAITEAQTQIFNGTTVVDPCPAGSTTGRCSTTTNLLKDLGNRAIDTLMFAAGAAGLIMILYGGVAYITAGADEAKTGKAKRILIYAIIGIIVAMASWMIRQATINANTKLNANSHATNL